MLEVDIYDSSQRVELDGKTYPRCCLVEDRDGIRILVVPDGSPISKSLWLRAHESGAQAILRTDTLAYILIEHFVSDRKHYGIPNSSTEAFQIPEHSWHRCVYVPEYAEMVSGSADAPPEGFVHLHTHTEYSGLDGLSTVDELLAQVLADGQTAVAITDHGICAGHPALQLAAQKKGVKPIFGMEAYFVDDRHNREGDKYGYWHLILWAMDDEGLRNLWAMSTESYRDGKWQMPQIDWDTLERLNKGVMVSTACLGGPLLEPWGRGDVDRAMANLGRLQAIFDDRLYIEIGTTQVPEQLTGNRWLLQVAREHQIPLIAVVDSHYPVCEDKFAHRTWLGVATHGELTEDSKLFAGGHDYHVMSEQEVRQALAYLPADVVDEAVQNTARVAARCTAKLVGKSHNPIYSRASDDHPDRLRHDEERLFDLCMKRWDERTQGKPYSQEVAIARFEREFRLIASKKYCGYYLMEWDMVIYAKENGVLVGPGRGSGGGSLVAYIIGITEIDPIEHDLLFERFMTEGRTALPDFDIDFPSNKKLFMLEYVARRWGADHVAIVGTHTRLQNKGAINDTARAMESVLPDDIFTDLKQVSILIDMAEASTAGLGLSWEELWTEHGEVLEPYRERYPELFDMATKLRGRLKTYSKHAAGVIIDPDEPLTGTLPLRGDGEGYMVTQFDKDVLEELGFVKFDMLNIRTLDTIQDTVDLIRQRRGHQVVPYTWREEYGDPLVWGEISDGWTLGVFQIETTAGTRLTKRFRPHAVADLADVITLVRPGPTRSGLTEQYFRRREGDEEITHLDDRMRALLGRTQGCMLYQEDILAVCMTIAGYGSDEADGVRKILGKKQVEKVAEAGRKFRQRAIANNTTEEASTLMWEQMAEFAKYSFGKAHATAYAIISYWTAWLKVHYPVEFLCAVLSTVKQERIPDFVGEARRMGYRVLPPDINESSKGFTATQMTVRYGLMSVKGIGEAASDAIMSAQPYTDWEDFLGRRGSGCNMGHVKTLVRIGAFDTLLPNRRGLEQWIEDQALPAAQRCQFRADTLNEHGLPCGYDWESEPVELGRSGKPKKGKPVPKKCTAACRRFSPREPLDALAVSSYTEADIRKIEMDFLGVFLSSTPFDRIPPEDRESLATAMDVLSGPTGSYLVAALIKNVRKRTDRTSRTYAFLGLTTEMGEMECIVFASKWEKFGAAMHPGDLAFVGLTKNNRGQSLDMFYSLES